MPQTYTTNRRHYVLKTSGGECLHIFYKPYEGICYSIQTGTHSWGPPSTLVRNVLPGFSVYLDKSDGIHILCQDSRGNILYVGRQDQFWRTLPVTRYKDIPVYEKYPGLYAGSSGILLFYIHDDRDKRVLVFQRTVQPDSFSAPKVIDTIKKNTPPFFVQGTADESVYLFYVRPGEIRDSSGYRVQSPGSKDWGDFIEISKNADSAREQILSVAKDAGGDFNVILQRIWLHKYDLVYIKLRQGQHVPEPETLLSSSVHPFSSASLVLAGQTRIVYWLKDDVIFYCLSPNNGITWKNAEKYRAGENPEYTCTRIFSNSSAEYLEMSGTDIPASLTEGFLPAFTEFIPEAAQALSGRQDSIPEPNETEDALRLMYGDESLQSFVRKLEALEGNLQAMNHKLLETEERQKKMELKVQALEQTVGTHTEEIKNTGRELEKLKVQAATPKPAIQAAAENYAPSKAAAKLPLMSGTGFAHITYDFLKNYHP